MSENEIIQERFEQLKAMHTIIMSINDEGAYMSWIYLIPDQADDDDLFMCAEDEEIFADACISFRSLIREYGGSGFYVGKEVY